MSTFADIQSKIQSGLPSQEIDLGDNRASMTLAQAQSLITQGVRFADGDTIMIVDTADSIEALSAPGISGLKGLGVDAVLANDRTLKLETAELAAFATHDVSVGREYQTVSGTKPSDTVVGTFLYSDGGQSFVELADGTFMAIYKRLNASGFYALFAQHYDAKGEQVGGEIAIAADDTAHRAQASVTLLDDGGYVVVWQRTAPGSQTDILSVELQRFNASGNPVGDRIAMTDPTLAYMPKITSLSGGDFLVSWINGNTMSLVAQRVDGETGSVDAWLTLGSYLSVAGAMQTEEASAYEIVPLIGGGVVVVWAANPQTGTSYDILAQALDAAGMPTGAAFAVNTTTAGMQVKPVVTALADGKFAVTWQSNNAGSGWDIMVRIYNANGSFVSGEAIASSYTASTQQNPAITTLEGGGFVVSWVSNGQDGSGLAVYGQVYDANGGKVGAEIHVSTATNGTQDRSQIKALAGGGFVVAWLESNDGGSARLKAKVFGAGGEAIGSEMTVNADTLAGVNTFKIIALSTGGFAASWYQGSDTLTFRLFERDTGPATLSGTASAISSLSASDIANLGELGIDKIIVSDGGNVMLSKVLTVGLIEIPGLRITGAGSVTVSSTSTSLDDFSVADVAKLKILGVTCLDASDNAVTLSRDQAMAYVGAGITLTSGDAATVEMTFLQLVELALDNNIDALVAFGMKIIDLIENAIALSLVGYRDLDSIDVRFAASDVLTLTDYKFKIVNLTVAQINELAEWGITKIDTNAAETEPAVLSLAQVKALAIGGISFAADELVHLSDGVTSLSSLSASDIADLETVGVSKVVVEQALALTVSQFNAYAQHGIHVQSLNGIISVRDTGTNFAALSADAIARLSNLGITTLDTIDDKVVLSLSAIKAYVAANAHFATDDRVVMGVTTASLSALNADDLVLVQAFGVAAITTAGSVLDIAVETAKTVRSAGLLLDSEFAARLADTAANLLTVSFQDVSSYREMGIDVFRLVDSGSVIAGLSLANIANLGGRSVSEVDVTNGAVTLSLAQANQFAASEIVFDAADTVVVTASSATLGDPDTLDLIGLAAIHVDRIDASDNKLSLTLATAQTYVAAGMAFTAADGVTIKISYAEAKTFVKATGSALHAAGVDRIEIDITTSELKALTYTELKTFVAAGVDGITGLTSVAFSNLTYDLVTHIADYNPVITSNVGGATATIAIAENTTAITTVLATDKEAATLTYSIVGGADKALFTINARTGALAFKSAPDCETPKDAGKNNVYDLIVQVSDGKLVDTQALAVNVKNVNEAPTGPTLSGTVVKENVAIGTHVGTFAPKDPEGKALSYKLLDTADAAFKLSGSKLVTAKAIDYEKVQKDTITIEVSDGVHKVAKVFTITVADILETITGTAKGEVLKGSIGMDRIVGSAGNDTLYGYAGNDILEGGDGNDVLIGGAGADRLPGGNGIDTASYAGAKAGVGASLAVASINTGDARGDSYSSIENLTGSSYGDRLTGDAKANVIYGGGGDDVLSGGAGNDRLIGGLGFDVLYGGAGSDRFVFRSVKELGTSKTAIDTIYDFLQTDRDAIDVTAIDANLSRAGDQAFTFIGTAKFSNAAGELRYEKTKANTYVYGDIDGNGKVDFILRIDAAPDLKAGDFLL